MNNNNNKDSNTGNRSFRNIVMITIVVIFSLILLQSLFNRSNQSEEVDYSTFIAWVESGQVSEVEIEGTAITGMRDGEAFRTRSPSDNNELLVDLLLEQGVTIRAKDPSRSSFFVSMLISVFPVLLLIGVWIYMMRRMQGGGNALSFGQSRARLVDKEFSKITFDDVAGIEEVKEEVKEIVEFLRTPQKFVRLGAEIPKGVLLVGAPGTGKTLLAKAIAGEADVPFFSISGSDFVEMFVGVGASRVRDLFNKGKQSAPAIIFIDEIDAVGRKRGAGIGGGHDEREQTLNQMLAEMDGFETNKGVIILASTNRPDVLDPALLRPGRFDRRITVPPPDLGGREAILKVHTRNKRLASNVDLTVLARRTPGFVGADLENLANEAALLAARKEKDAIGMADFEEAIDRVIAGIQRKGLLITEQEKEKIAYHESGHALVGYLLPNADPIHKISIVPRTEGVLGFTLQLPLEERYLVTRQELLDRVVGILGGRAAEELVFNEVSTGAYDDLKKATEIARRMVMEYGMSDEIGPLRLGRENGNVFLGEDIIKSEDHSEEMSSLVDKEIKKLITGCYTKAKELLGNHREALDKLTAKLLEKEVLEGDQLEAILNELAPQTA